MKFEQDKESWKVIELETEKLNWTLDWEDKLKREKEHWIKNELEPAKQKWKLESEERLRYILQPPYNKDRYNMFFFWQKNVHNTG